MFVMTKISAELSVNVNKSNTRNTCFIPFKQTFIGPALMNEHVRRKGGKVRSSCLIWSELKGDQDSGWGWGSGLKAG